MVPSNNIDTCRPSAVWTNFNLNMLVRLASARHPKYRLQERRGGFRPTLRRVVIGRRPTKMVHQITLEPVQCTEISRPVQCTGCARPVQCTEV
ncbi:uncharacterized protein [Dysidea avara]|uniref:uncharacterized protein isoform X2 n=1 Tax=Dysidea avara TaxID=196820 RepID=UPI00332FA2B2